MHIQKTSGFMEQSIYTILALGISLILYVYPLPISPLNEAIHGAGQLCAGAIVTLYIYLRSSILKNQTVISKKTVWMLVGLGVLQGIARIVLHTSTGLFGLHIIIWQSIAIMIAAVVVFKQKIGLWGSLIAIVALLTYFLLLSPQFDLSMIMIRDLVGLSMLVFIACVIYHILPKLQPEIITLFITGLGGLTILGIMIVQGHASELVPLRIDSFVAIGLHGLLISTWSIIVLHALRQTSLAKMSMAFFCIFTILLYCMNIIMAGVK